MKSVNFLKKAVCFSIIIIAAFFSGFSVFAVNETDNDFTSVEPVETEPATTATQSATTATENTTEMPSVTSNNSNKENNSFGKIQIVLSVIIILLLLAAAVIIRRKILLAIRNNDFSKGRNNKKCFTSFPRSSHEL